MTLDMERVRADVADLISYIPRLAELLPPDSTVVDEENKRHVIPGSKLPWNNAVAAVYMDIHAVRGYEDSLTLRAFRRAAFRGGSDACTVAVLEALPDLIAHVAVSHPASELPEWIAKHLRQLGRAARQVLDELRPNEEPWQRAPGGLLCPEKPDGENYCDKPLWLPPGFAAMRAPAVYCRSCKDEDGRLVSWPYDAWTAVLTEGDDVKKTTDPNFPTITVLCGSTRFYDAFQQANYDLTMAGHIVLSVGFYPHAKAVHGHGEGVGHDSAEKAALDELHKRKIDLADEVLVLNVGGYVGESTASEIEYAIAAGKQVRYLEAAEGLTA